LLGARAVFLSETDEAIVVRRPQSKIKAEGVGRRADIFGFNHKLRVCCFAQVVLEIDLLDAETSLRQKRRRRCGSFTRLSSRTCDVKQTRQPLVHFTINTQPFIKTTKFWVGAKVPVAAPSRASRSKWDELVIEHGLGHLNFADPEYDGR